MYTSDYTAGETCSVFYHVVQINYRPGEDAMEFIDGITESMTKNPVTQHMTEPISQA